jgi:hypothetical protein
MQLMAAGYEVLQPGQIVEGCGPFRTGRPGVKYVDRFYAYGYSGEAELATGHYLSLDWIPRFQRQQLCAQTANAYVLGCAKAKSMRSPELERSVRQHLKIGGSGELLRSPMIAHVLPR